MKETTIITMLTLPLASSAAAVEGTISGVDFYGDSLLAADVQESHSYTIVDELVRSSPSKEERARQVRAQQPRRTRVAPRSADARRAGDCASQLTAGMAEDSVGQAARFWLEVLPFEPEATLVALEPVFVHRCFSLTSWGEIQPQFVLQMGIDVLEPSLEEEMQVTMCLPWGIDFAVPHLDYVHEEISSSPEQQLAERLTPFERIGQQLSRLEVLLPDLERFRNAEMSFVLTACGSAGMGICLLFSMFSIGDTKKKKRSRRRDHRRMQWR